LKDDLKQIIKDIALKGEEVYSKVGKVTEVDLTARTCTVEPIDDSAALNNVRLQASINASDGIVLAPVVGSFVVCTFLTPNISVITLFTEVDSVEVKINNITLGLDKDEVRLNGTSLGGLAKVNDLVTKLNNLEGDLNTLKAALLSWVPLPNDGGAALKTSLGSYPSDTLTPTTVPDIENTNVKHG